MQSVDPIKGNPLLQQCQRHMLKPWFTAVHVRKAGLAAAVCVCPGLPLLQQRHRHLLKPCFAAVAKALEATSSPLAKLRTALHLEVAKAEADGESYSKARTVRPAESSCQCGACVAYSVVEYLLHRHTCHAFEGLPACRPCI